MENNKHLNSKDIATLLIIFSLLIAIVCNIKMTKQNSNFVDRQIVVNTDTLTVLHYIEHDNVFVISNGDIVDRKFIKNNLID